MKKYYTTTLFKKKNSKRAKASFRRTLIHKEKKRIKRVRNLRKSKEEIAEERATSKYVSVTAPRYFSFINEPESTIEFINKLENLYLKKKRVFVNLSKVEILDYSAVTVLVSVMFTFKFHNIGFDGNFPEKLELKKLLIDSEFFKYLSKPVGKKIEYTIGKENQIFTRANKEVNSELGLVVMAEASRTIWGVERTCKGLQRTLLELMQNTNNHAEVGEKGAKHWWLSVNHDKQNKKVKFVFVDYGIGIFESLKNKPQLNKWYGWFEKIKNRLLHGGNEEILKLLLEGEMHMTVTGQHFRGKGLPGIKEVLGRNQISNLHLISNNVSADVDNSFYKKLGKEFSGTFVSWELNEQNDNIQWIF